MFGQPAPAPTGDVELPLPPGADSIGALDWSPVPGDMLATGSWDNKLRVYVVQRSAPNGAPTGGQGKAEKDVGAPILDVEWKDDGATLFSAGCSKKINMWSLQTDQIVEIGAHDAPIKGVHWVKEKQFLVTCGWDKAIKYWDCRTATPQFTLPLPDKITAMDVRYPLLLVSTADKKIYIFHLDNPQKPYRVRAAAGWPAEVVARSPPPLRVHSRALPIGPAVSAAGTREPAGVPHAHDPRFSLQDCVCARVHRGTRGDPGRGGVAGQLGGVRGRGGWPPGSALGTAGVGGAPPTRAPPPSAPRMRSKQANGKSITFAYKCHREGTLNYAVNCIDTHPSTEYQVGDEMTQLRALVPQRHSRRSVCAKLERCFRRLIGERAHERHPPPPTHTHSKCFLRWVPTASSTFGTRTRGRARGR